MLSFATPWLFALLPLPLLLRWLLPPRADVAPAVRVPFGARLEQTLGATATERQPRRLLPWLVPLLVWLLLVAALARPQWLQPPVTKTQPTRDLLLLVDLSASMAQQDFTNKAGQQVDRLAAVKEVLEDFLARREGDRIGLVVFGDAPYLQSPFSTDLALSQQLLDEAQVGMAGPRTAFGDAIGLGISLFEHSDVPAKTIIALTDGNDTASQVPPLEAARVAQPRDIRIHTVAIGDPATVGENKLDEASLRATAAATGGKYFFAADRDALAGIYDELDRIETRKVEVISHRPRIELFPALVLAALVLALLDKLVLVLRQWRGHAAAVRDDGARVRVDAFSGRLEVVPAGAVARQAARRAETVS